MHGVHIPVYYPVNVSFFLIFAGLPTTQAKNINTKKCTRRRAEDQMLLVVSVFQLQRSRRRCSRQRKQSTKENRSEAFSFWLGSGLIKIKVVTIFSITD